LAVRADESGVVVKATSTNALAAATSPHVDTDQTAGSDDDSEHSACISVSTTTTTAAATATCRPSTRSTASPPVHSFYVDLTNRTGKAAKHFRRLYPATSTICECGQFPAFASQKQSSAPPYTLPEPLQRLCLVCLNELRCTFAQYSGHRGCRDVYDHAVLPMFWHSEWNLTRAAHYDHYYTPGQLAAITKDHGATFEWDRACAWIKTSLESELAKVGRMLEEIGYIGKKSEQS
jgi:hypothetical protein